MLLQPKTQQVRLLKGQSNALQVRQLILFLRFQWLLRMILTNRDRFPPPALNLDHSPRQAV